ncbi:MAG: multidrug efflux pump subunit AcrB [Saprospiraceae bacterium]
MNITEFSIKRSRITYSIIILIVLGGLVMYSNLAQDSMPPFTIRVATVVSTFTGAGPQRVEQLVTDKIEKKIQEIPEVKEINSQSRSGLSVVTVTLKDQVKPEKLQNIWDLVRRKVQTIERDLPEGVKWNLNDDGIGDIYGIMLGLVSDGFSDEELKDYSDDIKDRLIKLDEVAKVEVLGTQEEQVFIEYDNAQLSKYGLSASILQNTIGATNILFSGGEINQESEHIVLEPSGNFNEIEDLRSTIIPTGNTGEVVYLRDITTITKGYKSPRESMVRVDGMPALAISINQKEGSNIVELGSIIDMEIEAIRSELPVGLELKRLSSMDGFVGTEVDNFVSNLMQSILIVCGVMLIFLGLRTGVVIASLIPLVTLVTLGLMGVIDMGLNQVTLAGLIMALGMMVDNAVVVAESIMVKLEGGQSRMDAAVNSSKELFIPLLISTLTTSAAFLSFYLAESTMGDIVGPLFVVISMALITSWLLSLSVVSMLSYQFIKVGERSYSGFFGTIEKPFDLLSQQFDKIITWMRGYYEKIINWALGHRWMVIVGILVMFVGSLNLFGYIPFIFFPDSERNLITVDVNLPQGSRIEFTSGVVAGIESFIQSDLQIGNQRETGVIDWSSYIGEGPASYDLGYSADEPNTNYAHLLVNTTSGAINGAMIARIDSFAFNSYPDADVKVSRLAGGGGGTPIEILVSGEDPDELYRIAADVKTKLKGIPGTANVKDNWGPKIKKIIIDIDQDKAQRAGLTNQDIAISLQAGLGGRKTGDFREGEDNMPIILRNIEGEDLSVDNLESLNIFAQGSGANVPLMQVAQIRPEWQLPMIRRKDLFRTIKISSELEEGGNASSIMAVFTPLLEASAEEWPSNYNYELAGDDKNTADSMGSVIAWLPLCGFIIVMLLIVQFNSFRKTTMVLMTIPLGLIGVILGLLFLRSYFGFFAFLGIISLAGIVINNAIVLLDRIDIEIASGKNGVKAIIDAGKQRFRPIMLTTFTTILGLLPLYLGGGIMWEPLAVSIMIGLLFGTIITLVLIPVLFSLMFGVKE